MVKSHETDAPSRAPAAQTVPPRTGTAPPGGPKLLDRTHQALVRRRRNSFDRAITSRMLCDHGGLTQQEVAQVLGIGNGACVSWLLRRLARELESNRVLRNRIREMEDKLKCRRDSH